MTLVGLVAAGVALWLSGAEPPSVSAADEPMALSAATRVCVAAPGAVKAAAVRQGGCPGATTNVPADAWLAFSIPPAKLTGQGDVLLSTTDLFTVKRGVIEVFVDDAPPVRIRAVDPPAARPLFDGRLALRVSAAPTRPTQVLVRIELRDQRQIAYPERQLLIATAAGGQRSQASGWFWQGAFLGLALIMALYNAFLWRAERLAAAAWYSLTLIAIALYFAVVRNLLPLLPLPGAAWLSLLIGPVVGPLFAICFIGFVRSYADLGPRGALMTRVLLWINAAMMPMAILLDPLGFVALAATLVNVAGVLSGVATLSAVALSAYRGDRAARALVGSMLPPFVGILVQIGSMAGVFASFGWATAAMQLGVTAQIILLALALADRIRHLRADRDQVQSILRMTLPDVIADRLKAGETAIADRHPQVAVLFADLAGFTPLSAAYEPETIVRLLDALFTEIDELTARFGAEKIKTIGDCYMVVAGAPRPHADPAGALAELALALPAAVDRAMQRLAHMVPGLPPCLLLRVGLHIGPVVAGVLGQQKLAYDLWGDTVNTASRMESHGVIGRVQCTRQVVELLSDRYEFEPRGEVSIRGKGALEVWLLVGRRGG